MEKQSGVLRTTNKEVLEKKKKMRDRIKGLELEAPSVFREPKQLFGCRQALKVSESTGHNYLG